MTEDFRRWTSVLFVVEKKNRLVTWEVQSLICTRQGLTEGFKDTFVCEWFTHATQFRWHCVGTWYIFEKMVLGQP